VILEWQPCWLYFDLEFQRVANPRPEPQDVIEAFYMELDAFCTEVLGAPLDMDYLVELDSTTSEKFSKHVIVKRLCKARDLAFKTNIQAGRVVLEFVAYLHRRREVPGSKAGSLFFKKETAGAEAEVNKSDAVMKDSDKTGGSGVMPAEALRLSGVNSPTELHAHETCLVDTAVYTRNRCFRVLFSSKFSKNRPLKLVRGACLGRSSPMQLLHSLAAFVPAGTPLFEHSLTSSQAPPEVKVHRPLRRTFTQRCARKLRRLEPSGNRELLQFLVQRWDEAREQNEPRAAQLANGSDQKTQARSCIKLGDQHSYLAVTLAHNRFCFCKGASHKSNSIYLVVDITRGVFYQKCHDKVDCPNFRSTEQALPEHLLEKLAADTQKSNATGEATGSVAIPHSISLMDELAALDLKPLVTAALSENTLSDGSLSKLPVALPLRAAEDAAPFTPPTLPAVWSSRTPPPVQRGTEERRLQVVACMPMQKECAPTLKDCGPSQFDSGPTQKDSGSTQKDCVPTQKDCTPTPKDCAPNEKERGPTQGECGPTQKDDESESQPATECETESESFADSKSSLPVADPQAVELPQAERRWLATSSQGVGSEKTPSMSSSCSPGWLGLENLLFNDRESPVRRTAPKVSSVRSQSSFCSRLEDAIFEEEQESFSMARLDRPIHRQMEESFNNLRSMHLPSVKRRRVSISIIQ